MRLTLAMVFAFCAMQGSCHADERLTGARPSVCQPTPPITKGEQ